MYKRVVLYLHSIRYLRLVQIVGRFKHIFRWKVLYRLPHSHRKFISPHETELSVCLLQFPPINVTQDLPHDFEEGRFVFLNQAVQLGSPVNWFPDGVSQLWVYNLHYFEYSEYLIAQFIHDGNEQSYELWKTLVSSWMNSCPIATPIAWDPYPTSLRVSQWIKVYCAIDPAIIARDREFFLQLLNSLFSQVMFLENNIEYHLLGNHLVENGRALLLSGLFFDAEPSNRWYQKGAHILWTAFSEQFTEDGAHFELSPMYHKKMLDLYSEICGIMVSSNEPVPEEVSPKIERMEEWLIEMSHPDGMISLFNDSSLISTEEVRTRRIDYVPATGLRCLDSSGYYIFRDVQRRDYLVFDCGPLGPDYLPGHGHCDMLSYELSISGQRMIVDSGVTNYYGSIEWRAYCRSTRAHNTLIVNNEEQSEIWGRFRVSKRARSRVVSSGHARDLSYLIGLHTGYMRLPGSPVHERWISWIDQRFWLICDHVITSRNVRTESLIHLNPIVDLERRDTGVEGRAYQIRQGQNAVLNVVPWGMDKISIQKGETSPLQGWYCPEFGISNACPTINMVKESEKTFWYGYLLLPHTHMPEVTMLEYSEEGGAFVVSFLIDGKAYRIVHRDYGIYREI